MASIMVEQEDEVNLKRLEELGEPLLSKSKDDLFNSSKSFDFSGGGKLYALIHDFASKADMCLLLLGTFSAIANSYLMPFQTLLLGDAFSKTGGIDKDMLYENIVKTAPMMVYLGFISFALSFVQYFSFIMAGARITSHVKRKAFNKLLEQEMAFFDASSPGELASTINEQSVTFEVGSAEALVDSIYWTFRFFFGYYIAFSKNWKVALAMTVTLPANSGSLGIMIYYIIKYAKRTFAANDKATGFAHSVIGGVQTIQSLGGNILDKVTEKYDERLKLALWHGESLAKVVGIGMGLVYFTIFLSFGIGYWFGSFEVVNGRTFGDILTPVMSCVIGSISIGILVPNITAVIKASIAAKTLLALINRKSKELNTKITDEEYSKLEVGDKIPQGRIEFRDVTFSYPTRPQERCLQNVTFTVNPGEKCALVGASGSGKSTCFQLLKQFYTVDKGKILFDNRVLETYPRNYLKKHIALVPQEPTLFHGSIIENLKFAQKDATIEEIEKACRIACAHDFISAFPNGYNTELSGCNLSGGQKQRKLGSLSQGMCLTEIHPTYWTRAIICDPTILLLDEATSALDNKSQIMVQESIDLLLSQRKNTTMIIAHRLSTIKTADRILLLENRGNGGHIVEEGTHSELLQGTGPYSRLFQLQFQRETHGNAFERISQSTNTGFCHSILPDVQKQDRGLVFCSNEKSILVPKNKGTKLALGKLLSMASSEKWWYYLGAFGSCLKGASQPVLAIVMASLLVSYVLVPFPFTGMPSPCHNQSDCSRREVCEKLRLPKGFPRGMLCVTPCSTASECPSHDSCFDFRTIGFLNGSFCTSGYTDGHGPDDVRHAGNSALLLYAIIGAFTGIGIALQSYSFQVVGKRLGKRLKLKMFSSIVSQDAVFFDEPQNAMGILMTRLSTDAAIVQDLLGDVFGVISENCFALVVALVIAFLSSWRMTIVVLFPMAGLAYTEYFQHKQMRSVAQSQILVASNVGKVVSEAIDNIKTVKSYENGAPTMNAKYEAEIARSLVSSRKKAFLFALSGALSQTCYFLSYALSLLWGGHLLKADSIDPENLSKVLFILSLTATFFGQSAARCGDWTIAKTAILRIMELIDRKPAFDPNCDEGIRPSSFKGEIICENVSFSYPCRAQVCVLRNVSCTIEAGKTVAFVGHTGCGKSTLIRLLLRFYDVSLLTSRILYDGVDLRLINLKWFRIQVGLCSQEPILFEGSIYENVAIGCDGATEEMVLKACKLANAHDFITVLESGYQTECGAKGALLSGGQKQRIALARALIKNPKLLFLDEATGALDVRSEAQVQMALDLLINRRERTIVIIAHRLTTIRNADKIYVLNNPGNGGTIVEEGNHEELIAIKNGYYANLYRESDKDFDGFPKS